MLVYSSYFLCATPLDPPAETLARANFILRSQKWEITKSHGSSRTANIRPTQTPLYFYYAQKIAVPRAAGG